MRTLLLLWAALQVESQPGPLPLPLHLSLSGAPSWQYLPLVQSGLGQVFSNSSPFASTHSLLLLPPASWAPAPELQASYGPYSVTQPLSSLPTPPLSPLSPLSLSASLLSEHVQKERDELGLDRFSVRALFHQRPDSHGACVSLHAFRETEEQRASCSTRPPLGFCVVTLTLPTDWFRDDGNIDQSERRTAELRSRRVKHRPRQRRGHGLQTSPTLRFDEDGEEGEDVEGPEGLRFQRPTKNQIQLYYSMVETSDLDFISGAPACEEDQWLQTQRQLFFLRSVSLKEDKPDQTVAVQTKEEQTCLDGPREAELVLDSHVVIGYSRAPVLIGQPIRVSVSLRANVSQEFVIVRLKVQKGLVSLIAQRTLSSDLWAVTLERSQGPDHDVVSILCHKHHTAKHKSHPSSLQQVVCLSVDGLRRSFGVAMSVKAQWWVEYSGHSLPPPHGAGESVFTFTDRPIIGVAPVTESKSLLNTAVLTSHVVSLPVIVLAVSRSGKVSDVTSAVTCRSDNDDIIKVSSDCSSVFVDGSESGEGNTCARVSFSLGSLTGALCLQVWAPSVPLRVSLADPVLNAIQGWDYYTDKGCEPVYQRTSVQVLTQFQALDSRAKTQHFLVSSDWLVDVTELVRDWLRIEDPRVASLGKLNTVIGRQPGKTTVYVVSAQWDGTLGGCDLSVTSDPVAPGDLSAQVVSGLGMTLSSGQTQPDIVTTTVTAYNILYNYHQEASISVWLQFSDDTSSPLSSFSDVPSFLRLSSLADSVLAVSPGSRQRLFATGDGGGPLLRAELMVATCHDRPLTSNLLTEDHEEDNSGGLRRLARGSGWIRVNLDMDYAAPTVNPDDFEFGFGDTLAEVDGDVYTADLEREKDEFARKAKQSNNNEGGLLRNNGLERAMLMPDQAEGQVFFAPSQEKEDVIDGEFDLEVGLGAVLSLICLFVILFLANCLPCALRDRGKSKDLDVEECDRIDETEATDEKEKEEQKNGKDVEENEGKVDESDVKVEAEQGTIVELPKEVEIIC